MKQRKAGYGILLTLTVLLTLAAVVTLIPNPSASKPSLLGYKSVCSFAPVAPLILLIAAGLVCVVRKRLFTENRQTGSPDIPRQT